MKLDKREMILEGRVMGVKKASLDPIVRASIAFSPHMIFFFIISIEWRR